MTTTTRPAKPTTAAPNVATSTGTKVHAGRWSYAAWANEWQAVPACSRNFRDAGWTTEAAVTCGRCGSKS